MMEGSKSKEVLESWLKDWSFSYISSKGHSGGLVTTWNQEFVEIEVTKHSTVLKIVLKEKSTRESFYLYNVYGPYEERKGLWESFFT